MLKRKLWSTEEDSALEKLMVSQPDAPQWDIIATKMTELNFCKTAKQCKDRWVNNLSPLLNKSKWTLIESQELFDQYLQNGNKWKNISKIFIGRTDNAVKNQFFSVIRKSLRTMNKFLGISCNTGMINSIRPKILAELLSPESVNQLRSNLVQKFAFTPYAVLTKEIDTEEREAVAKCVKFVIEENELYIARKMKKPKIKKTSKSVTTSRSSQIAKTEVNVEVLSNLEMSIEGTDSLRITESAVIVTETEKFKNDNIKWIEGQIEELFAFQNSVQKQNQNDPNFLKQNMVEFFAKITHLSSKIQNILEHTQDPQEIQHLVNYLGSAYKLTALFRSFTNAIEEKQSAIPSIDENSEHDILGSIHNFNPNKDNDTVGYLKQTILTPKNNDNYINSPQNNPNYWNKRNTISTEGNAELNKERRNSVCIYDAEIDKGYELNESYTRERRLYSEAFNEMMEEFECSESYL